MACVYTIHNVTNDHCHPWIWDTPIKEALYRMWCGVNRRDDSGVNRLGDTSAFVNPAGQLLLIRQGKTRMYSVDILFELYTDPL